MYKVFFNDRKVFLTDEFFKNFQERNGLFYKLGNKEDLEELIDFYSRLKLIDSLYIFHHDIDELRSIFRSCFENIDAAGGLIRNSKDEVLMIYRRGKWDLPKGKIDKGETPKETSLREVKEECGITDLKIIDPLLSTYHTYQLNLKMVLKKTYWYRMFYNGSAIPIPQTSEDITMIKWFKVEELPGILNNTFSSVIDVLSYENLVS